MKLGIFGKLLEDKDLEAINQLFDWLREYDMDWCIENDYYNHLNGRLNLENAEIFHDATELKACNVNCLLCLGGDGSLLETLAFVKKSNIPVLGINFGRLGFLSQVSKTGIQEALFSIQNGHFRLEKRTVLELKSEKGLFKPFNFALNDFTIHKRDTGSMISIDTYLNGDYFNTYWADGIIVSTPTGSTAYSLSCGGPIIFPDSNNFVLTPVAPHNLNIRPIIVSDNTVITFRVKGRGANHLISLDARYEIIEDINEIAIQKADFLLNLIKLNKQNFIVTLRDKLKWGLDPRNL